MEASDNENRVWMKPRAGWLHFIAGHTQDEIAKMLRFRAPRPSVLFHSSPSADHLPAGTSDYGMHGTGRAAAGLVSSGLLRSGADRLGRAAIAVRAANILSRRYAPKAHDFGFGHREAVRAVGGFR
jgi:hypothetical protein